MQEPVCGPHSSLFILLISCPQLSLQIDYRNPGTAELHMFVLEVTYAGHRLQVVADERAQAARTSPGQDTHAEYSQHDGIVDEVGHRLDRLVATHAAHVDVLFELQLLLIHTLLRAGADER